MLRLALACSLSVLLAACVDADGDPGSEAAGPGPGPSTGGDATTDATTAVDPSATTGPDEPGTTGEPTTDATTLPETPATTGTYGPCGDGILDEYESCDLGADNDDNGACTTACRHAVCGDGLVHLGMEWCDDGNAMNGDDCLVSCKHAYCGDGVVKVGHEECDDGNATDADTCNNMCVKPLCDDGVKNGFESDVDCGGNSCAGCTLGEACVDNLDCSGSICTAGQCSPAKTLMPPNCAPATVSAQQAYNAVKPSCGCHSNGAGELKFTSADSFRDNMVDVPAKDAAMPLVKPGDINNSYLLYKILNQQNLAIGGRGSPMPLGKPLSDTNKCLLINWVKSGAD
jgi:cysteine-rich repeat protein